MKKLVLILIFLASGWQLQAQYYSPKQSKEEAQAQFREASFWDKTRFGGNIWFSFGASSTVFLQPTIYHDVTPRLMMGLGATYIYQKTTVPTLAGDIDHTQNVWGGRALLFFRVWDQLNLTGDLNYSKLEYQIDNTDRFEQEWIPSLYLGIQYGIRMGRSGYTFVGVSYDVLHDERRSLYSSPWQPSIAFAF